MEHFVDGNNVIVNINDTAIILVLSHGVIKTNITNNINNNIDTKTKLITRMTGVDIFKIPDDLKLNHIYGAYYGTLNILFGKQQDYIDICYDGLNLMIKQNKTFNEMTEYIKIKLLELENKLNSKEILLNYKKTSLIKIDNIHKTFYSDMLHHYIRKYKIVKYDNIKNNVVNKTYVHRKDKRNIFMIRYYNNKYEETELQTYSIETMAKYHNQNNKEYINYDLKNIVDFLYSQNIKNVVVVDLTCSVFDDDLINYNKKYMEKRKILKRKNSDNSSEDDDIYDSYETRSTRQKRRAIHKYID